MERRKFVKSCFLASAIGITAPSLFSACAAFKSIPFEENAEQILIQKDNLPEQEHKIAVIYPKALSYPIAISRVDGQFKAFLLACTHQGAVLNAYGSQLVCEAHGSAFNNKGSVLNGPAQKNLKTFPVQEGTTYLSIQIS